jgi:hypothetical protein
VKIYEHIEHTLYVIHMAYAERQKRYVSEPTVGEFKGNMTLSIPVGKDGEAFTFGTTKARAIVKYIEDIKVFIEESDRKFGGK